MKRSLRIRVGEPPCTASHVLLVFYFGFLATGMRHVARPRHGPRCLQDPTPTWLIFGVAFCGCRSPLATRRHEALIVPPRWRLSRAMES